MIESHVVTVTEARDILRLDDNMSAHTQRQLMSIPLPAILNTALCFARNYWLQLK